MNLVLPNEHSIGGILRVEPSRKMKSSFNENEFTISVPHADREQREGERNLEKEEDDKPLVI